MSVKLLDQLLGNKLSKYSPLAVKATYGISWCYVLGDVAYEGHKAK